MIKITKTVFQLDLQIELIECQDHLAEPEACLNYKWMPQQLCNQWESQSITVNFKKSIYNQETARLAINTSNHQERALNHKNQSWHSILVNSNKRINQQPRLQWPRIKGFRIDISAKEILTKEQIHCLIVMLQNNRLIQEFILHRLRKFFLSLYLVDQVLIDKVQVLKDCRQTNLYLWTIVLGSILVHPNLARKFRKYKKKPQSQSKDRIWLGNQFAFWK